MKLFRNRLWKRFTVLTMLGHTSCVHLVIILVARCRSFLIYQPGLGRIHEHLGKSPQAKMTLATHPFLLLFSSCPSLSLGEDKSMRRSSRGKRSSTHRISECSNSFGCCHPSIAKRWINCSARLVARLVPLATLIQRDVHVRKRKVMLKKSNGMLTSWSGN